MAKLKVESQPVSYDDGNPSVVKRNQSGVKRNPSNVKRNPSGVKRDQSGVKRGETVFGFMEKLIYRLKNRKQDGTARNYRAALGSFRRFRNGEDLTWKAFNPQLVEDYQIYLKSKGLAPNSTSFYMRIMRAVYNRAVKEDLIIDRHPFRTVFTGIEKTRKRALPPEEIRRIRDLDLSRNKELEFARNIFLFLFYCRGMSLIDALFLKKSDLANGVITYRRHKTGQRLHIKVIPKIRDFLDRYPSADSHYLLPLIKEARQNERRQYETALRRINRNLKRIGVKAGISIPLTTYVSRHSWATIANTKNIPINVISDSLGHESISTTQIYLASIDAAVIDRANEIVVDDL